MSAAREEILERTRKAIGNAQVPEVPRGYRREGGLDSEVRLELFCERAADYKAQVHRVHSADLDAALTDRCEVLGARRLAAPAAVEWRPRGTTVELDSDPIPATRLDQLDGVLTGSALAIAETGTVVLDGSELCGRRALTLVPDLHLCVVAAEDVVETVPEAVSRLAPAVAAGAPLTFISGPSATSDIELRRVDGVHGPRQLELFVLWY